MLEPTSTQFPNWTDFKIKGNLWTEEKFKVIFRGEDSNWYLKIESSNLH